MYSHSYLHLARLVLRVALSTVINDCLFSGFDCAIKRLFTKPFGRRGVIFTSMLCAAVYLNIVSMPSLNWHSLLIAILEGLLPAACRSDNGLIAEEEIAA